MAQSEREAGGGMKLPGSDWVLPRGKWLSLIGESPIQGAWKARPEDDSSYIKPYEQVDMAVRLQAMANWPLASKLAPKSFTDGMEMNPDEVERMRTVAALDGQEWVEANTFKEEFYASSSVFGLNPSRLSWDSNATAFDNV